MLELLKHFVEGGQPNKREEKVLKEVVANVFAEYTMFLDKKVKEGGLNYEETGLNKSHGGYADLVYNSFKHAIHKNTNNDKVISLYEVRFGDVVEELSDFIQSQLKQNHLDLMRRYEPYVLLVLNHLLNQCKDYVRRSA